MDYDDTYVSLRAYDVLCFYAKGNMFVVSQDGYSLEAGTNSKKTVVIEEFLICKRNVVRIHVLLCLIDHQPNDCSNHGDG
jgi:hypothetical protein